MLGRGVDEKCARLVDIRRVVAAFCRETDLGEVAATVGERVLVGDGSVVAAGRVATAQRDRVPAGVGEGRGLTVPGAVGLVARVRGAGGGACLGGGRRCRHGLATGHGAAWSRAANHRAHHGQRQRRHADHTGMRTASAAKRALRAASDAAGRGTVAARAAGRGAGWDDRSWDARWDARWDRHVKLLRRPRARADVVAIGGATCAVEEICADCETPRAASPRRQSCGKRALACAPRGRRRLASLHFSPSRLRSSVGRAAAF